MVNDACVNSNQPISKSSELSAYPPQRYLAERMSELEYYKYHMCCIYWSRARIGHDETGR